LNWVFPLTTELLNTEVPLQINEREYFDDRRKKFGIEFKKEPPKAVT